MSIQHTQLAEGRWFNMPFVEQMANIGSEVERALNWKARNNTSYCQKAFERALELLDISLDDSNNRTHLKELARVREAIVDYFFGMNEFNSSESSWRKYFSNFTYAARRNH
jgi:hypothetical protein